MKWSKLDTHELASAVLAMCEDAPAPYPFVVGPCWLYTGRLNRDGYGEIRSHGRHYGMVHRIIWRALHLPMPDGWTLDHLCNRRHCVSPFHLEAVTHMENIRRARLRRQLVQILLAA